MSIVVFCAELVEDYESRKWPIDTTKVTVQEILQSFMDDHGMTASDLGRLLGDRSLGHKILTGKRKLTTSQVKTLAGRFCVGADLFI